MMNKESSMGPQLPLSAIANAQLITRSDATITISRFVAKYSPNVVMM
jgi:hypothetical protein